MSTEYYYGCRWCQQAIHFGTRYLGGFKLQTIGPSKERVEAFWNQHLFHGDDNNLCILDEHQVFECPETGDDFLEVT